MATTYGYHYGGKINRGDRYGKVTSKAYTPKANLGEGRSSAKSNNSDFADFKAWYAKQDRDTKAAMDKAADKPTSRFSNEERDSFYSKVDADHYQQYLQFRYPGKTEYIQSRMKSYYGFRRHIEENGLVPKDSAETKPETQYAEQVVKEQANPEKSAEDKATDAVRNEALGINKPKSKPAETKVDQPAANPEKIVAEKPSEGATAESWFADALTADLAKLDAERPAREAQKAREKQDAEDVQAAIERQAAQDMVNNSTPSKKNEQPAWVTIPWRDIVNNIRDRNTPSPIPPNRLTGDAYPIVRPNIPYTEFNWVGDYGNLPFYNKNAVNRQIPDAMHAPNFYLSPLEPPAPYEYGSIVKRKAAEKAYKQKLNRQIAIENAVKDGLWGLGILGATAGTFYGLDKLGKYIRQNDSDEQSQTQVPYQMEPEQETARVELPVVPVSEEQPVTELTPEQQFVLQSLSPFDYAKAANLFDLYDRYGSLASSSNSANNEELIDEVMNETILPQEPPDAGTNIEDANLIIPEATEIPEDVNDAMRKAKPGSFWKTTRGMVAPKVQAVKGAAQSAYERALKRSKSTPVTAEEPAGPVVLNAPKQRKVNSKINSQNAAKQALGVSEKVNNLAREAYDFNQYQNSQKPEAALAQSLVRAQQESGLTTDAIWNRLRQKGLVSPEQAIRSGLFTPDEVRYITENDLWRYK